MILIILMAMNIEVSVDGVVAGIVRRLMLMKFVLGRIGQDKLCGLQAAQGSMALVAVCCKLYGVP